MDAAAANYRRPIVALIAACALAIVAFAAYHFYLRELMLDRGLTLGAVRPGVKVYRIVPLYLYWRPRLKTGVLIATAVCAAFVWWLRRSMKAANVAELVRVLEGPDRTGQTSHEFGYVGCLMMWHVAIAVAVAVVDGGPATLAAPFTIHHRSDYIGAVERIDDPATFLRDYPALMPDLPLHCRHHPPGGPLLLWLIARLLGPGPVAASVAVIVLSSLAAPAVSLLAREVLNEGTARLAAGLFVLAPNVVAYSATCMDAVFMVPLVWTIYFLWRGRYRSPIASGIAAGLFGSLAALMTFSTSVVALWAIVSLAATALVDRSRLCNAALTLALAAASSLLFYAALHLCTGYDPLAVLQQAFAGQDEIMKGRGHNSFRQSAHFAVTNLAAFAFCSGLPIVLLWLRQTAAEIRGVRLQRGTRCLLLSFAAALLLVDLAPLYTLETERIWIFLVGFVAIGAAAWLGRFAESPLVTTVLLLQAGQTIAMEMLFEWVW